MKDTDQIPEGYALRKAIESDIPALQRADLAASALFVPTGLIEFGEEGIEPIPSAELERGLSDDLLFVVTNPFGDPIGFVLNRVHAPDLYLEQISVDPAHGRRGLGAALVKLAIAEAETRGLKSVVLSTFRDLAWNGPFYSKFGFKELPRTQLKPWMLDLEKTQAESMDVSLRCFMRRPGKPGLMARVNGRSKQKSGV